MKKLISVILICICILSFTACQALSEKMIVGTWKTQTDILGIVTESEYIFNEDGTGTMSTVLGIGIAMKYTVGDDSITIVTDTPALQKTFVYTYEFDADTLILTDDKGDSITLTKS